jgi:hypothetical protein
MDKRGFRGRAGVVVASVALIGCDDGGEPLGDGVKAFELVGEWTSAFGSETITAERWTSFDTAGAETMDQIIVSFDNAANSAVVQNPPDAAFGPGTYGRIVWTEPADTGFAYCTVAFGHATEAEAEAAPETDVDRDDLAGKGCAGFPWSVMAPK